MNSQEEGDPKGVACKTCLYKRILPPESFPRGHLWKDYCGKVKKRIPLEVHVGMFPYPEWCPDVLEEMDPFKPLRLTEEQREAIRKLLVGEPAEATQ